MKVAVAFPAGNTDRANATLAKWHSLGYFSAVLIDAGMEPPNANRVLVANPYPGFAVAANDLCFACVEDGADIVVVAGDDLDPVPDTPAEVIADEFVRHFGGTFGVLQPAGDKYGALNPACSSRAAVSPWIGKEYIRRANGGKGPYWPEYLSLYPDAELRAVAIKLGVYWEEEKWSQYHHHWTRRGNKDTLPVQMRKAIIDRWDIDKAIYFHRAAAGFPGSDPIP